MTASLRGARELPRRSAQSIIYSLEGEEALTVMGALLRLDVGEQPARGKDVAGAAD